MSSASQNWNRHACLAALATDTRAAERKDLKGMTHWCVPWAWTFLIFVHSITTRISSFTGLNSSDAVSCVALSICGFLLHFTSMDLNTSHSVCVVLHWLNCVTVWLVLFLSFESAGVQYCGMNYWKAGFEWAVVAVYSSASVCSVDRFHQSCKIQMRNFPGIVIEVRSEDTCGLSRKSHGASVPFHLLRSCHSDLCIF